MNKYSQIAIMAAKSVQDGKSPQQAWEDASCAVFAKGSASQRKGCPKNAFLGLFDSKNNSKNATYARTALTYLRTVEDTNISPQALWLIVLNGERKAYNNQMHVVLDLYNAGYIK